MVTKAGASRIAFPNDSFDVPGALYDQRRTRTAWFEGQHVTADQFNRDQSYHVTRLADLGRTIGRGVVEGFTARADPLRETMLLIGPGLGLAGSGEVMSLPIEAEIDLADVATQRRLNAMLADPGRALPPPETRTGLYVLAASTVEYSSNPVGSYPVSATASRTLEDSLINEAVLFTLTPFPVPAIAARSADWRAAAAYRIFVEGGEPDLPAAALPLAMVALQGNRVLWVDVPLVRRHCAPAAGDVFGLGMVDGARRIAHYEQYDALIDAVIATNPAAAMPASDLVMALPPMGRMPVGSVALRAATGEPDRLSQNWLPAVMPVELVALPEDEIEALLRESVDLPPIDLAADPAVLANLPVTIIVPVRRADWAATPAEVAEEALPLVPPPAVGGTTTDPAALLRALIDDTPLPTPGDALVTAAWRALIGPARHLWFLRRRQFQRSDLQVSGNVANIPLTGSTVTTPPPATPPLVSDAEAEAMAAEIAAPLTPLFKAMGMERVFAKQLDLPLAERLPMLIRQGQLRAAGGDALALAMAHGVIVNGISVEKELALQVVSSAAPYAAAEPAITGAPMVLQVTLAPGGDGDTVAQVGQDLSGIPADALRELMKTTGGVTLASDQLSDPGALNDVLTKLHDAKAEARFAFSDPLAEKTVAARLRIVNAGAVGAVAGALARVKPEERAKFITKLRQLVIDHPTDDRDLGTALVREAKRIT